MFFDLKNKKLFLKIVPKQAQETCIKFIIILKNLRNSTFVSPKYDIIIYITYTKFP